MVLENKLLPKSPSKFKHTQRADVNSQAICERRDMWITHLTILEVHIHDLVC